jgi:hypothetical protein
MDRRTLVLQKIWSKKVAEWDHYYGPLTEALATHYGHSAVQILLNANGRIINTLIKGMLMFYKFEDESDNLFRITVEEIPLEELARILHELE